VSQIAIYPGSFDPITLGHLSVLTRAASVFPQVQLVVVHNPSKSSVFSIAERMDLVQSALTEVGAPGSISVSSLGEGLLVQHAKALGANAIIKGFRTASDVEYELPMALVNKDLSGIETVFLAAEAGFGFVSSSLVREVASLGGDVSKYVTDSVAKALKDRYAK
jgi:pantetheine-phosphate adenylyltransferase